MRTSTNSQPLAGRSNETAKFSLEDDDPIVGSGPVDPEAELTKVGFNPQPEPPRPMSPDEDFWTLGFNPQPEPPGPMSDFGAVGFNPQPEPPKWSGEETFDGFF